MPSPRTIVVALLTAVCVAITLALFDRAYPLVDVGLRLSRDGGLAFVALDVYFIIRWFKPVKWAQIAEG